MANVRNHKNEVATSAGEGTAMLEPLCNRIRHHEQALADFTRSHKSKLQNMRNRIKSLTEEEQKFQKSVLQKDAIIKELCEKIDSSKEEILSITEVKNFLTAENKSLKQNLIANEKNFTNLEIIYDQNVASFRSQLKEKQQEIENQINKFHTQKDELITARKNLEKSGENFQKLQQEFDDFKSKSNEESEKLSTAHKVELNILNDKLLQKDDEINRIREEKLQMEAAKNKIIDEQTYKINTIERVFEQPVMRVQPHPNLTPESADSEPPSPPVISQVGRPEIQHSVSMSKSTTRAIITAMPTASQTSTQQSKHMRRSLRETSNSQTRDELSSSTTKATVNSKRPVKRRFIEVEENHSDSDSDVSMPSINLNLRNSTSLNPIGFGPVNRNVVTFTNSNNSFEKLKRCKNE